MANIKVPIGRGIIGQVQQEFKKDEPQPRAQSEGQWLNSLANQGKIQSVAGSGSQSSEILSFVVPNGSTLYLLQASYGFNPAGAASSLGTLRAGIGGTNRTIKQASRVDAGDADLTKVGFSLVGNGTDDINILVGSTAGTYHADITFYLENTTTTGSRGSTTIV